MVHVDVGIDQQDVGNRSAQDRRAEPRQQASDQANRGDLGDDKMPVDPAAWPHMYPFESGILEVDSRLNEDRIVFLLIQKTVCPDEDGDSHCDSCVDQCDRIGRLPSTGNPILGNPMSNDRGKSTTAKRNLLKRHESTWRCKGSLRIKNAHKKTRDPGHDDCKTYPAIDQ